MGKLCYIKGIESTDEIVKFRQSCRVYFFFFFFIIIIIIISSSSIIIISSIINN